MEGTTLSCCSATLGVFPNQMCHCQPQRVPVKLGAGAGLRFIHLGVVTTSYTDRGVSIHLDPEGPGHTKRTPTMLVMAIYYIVVLYYALPSSLRLLEGPPALESSITVKEAIDYCGPYRMFAFCLFTVV